MLSFPIHKDVQVNAFSSIHIGLMLKHDTTQH